MNINENNMIGRHVGFEIGETVFDAGKVVSATATGKTLQTDSGFVFKSNARRNGFALQGNGKSRLVFFGDRIAPHAASQRGRKAAA